jgi:TonB family protein
MIALAALAVTRDATAQSNDIASTVTGPTTPDPRFAALIPIREAIVRTKTAQFTITRQGNLPVRVAVQTDSGTFVLTADSSVVAHWADSAATLPESPTTGSQGQVSFKTWELRAEGDSIAHMRFCRIPTSNGSDLLLALSNGSWGKVEMLGQQSALVLAALRGDSVLLGDSTHISRKTLGVPFAFGPPLCRAPDHPRPPPSGMTVSACGQIEKQARQLDHTRLPAYPRSLQREGVTGHVILQFVVETSGRVDPRTIQLISATDLRLAYACWQALPAMRFAPAELDGKKVRELVTLPFDFSL